MADKKKLHQRLKGTTMRRTLATVIAALALRDGQR